MRGTTRDPARAAALQAAGVEPFVADPDRVATLVPAFAQVGVACVLLGSAAGTAEAVSALHTTRLEMLLEKMVDTTLRGLVYECAGSAGGEVLGEGAARVERSCARWGLPYALLDADPGEPAGVDGRRRGRGRSGAARRRGLSAGSRRAARTGRRACGRSRPR